MKLRKKNITKKQLINGVNGGKNDKAKSGLKEE
jgi:hypothetical protein